MGPSAVPAPDFRRSDSESGAGRGTFGVGRITASSSCSSSACAACPCCPGLVGLFCFGSGLFCLHLLAFGLDAEFFVDARLKEGAKLLGIAANKGVLGDRHALVGEHGHKDALAVEHVVELLKREELRLAALAPDHQPSSLAATRR